jgi:phage-related protein
MSARSYDVILSVDDASGFVATNVLVGNTTATSGIIANVNLTTNELKVKLNNIQQEFSSSELVHSNTLTLATGSGGDGLLSTSNFVSNVISANSTTAIATISSITPSAFKAEKNSFSQNPIVRLYTIYYPGEWYPPNDAGNPTGQGTGKAWPNDFPIRFAEVVGDLTSDLSYNVSYGGTSYIPFPVNASKLGQGSEGSVDEITLDVFNVDNIITRLIEDPFLAGNNSSNSVTATVNGELVNGIDPRTVVGTTSNPDGLNYDADIVGYYGRSNASFDRTQTLAVGGTWTEQKQDTRDLLGGVVEIKTTFANFLDYWPEYSSIQSVSSNVIEVYNTLPYRVGDNVRARSGTIEGTIQSIERNSFLFLSNDLEADLPIGEALYIVNPLADSESYVEDKFKIDQLEKLSDDVATFNLISWLQYFKLVTPKRKFYKNTCQWVYKGPECQYPGPGSDPIPGSSPVLTANSNPIAANNQVAADSSGDVCSKSLLACTLRNNQLHFGGFPGTGRTIPRG